MPTTTSAAASSTGTKAVKMETRSRTRSRKRDAVDHEHEDEEMRLANGQREATRKALKDEGSMRRATGTFNLRRAHSSRALKSAKTVNNLCTHASKASFRLTRSNSRISADEKERSKNDFLEAHARVKRQIQNMGRTTISPQSTFLMYWDVLTAVAMIWTAFVTPFEVGFLSSEEHPASPLSVMNRMVDGVFICDMVINFFTPYRAHPTKGGQWVFSNRKIALNYLRSWFSLDLATAIPFDFLISSAMSAGGGGDGADAGDAGYGAANSRAALQMLRVFRIAKLARVLRASRVYKRWIDYMSLSYASQSLVGFLVLTCVLAHWLACIWGYTGHREDASEPETWHSRLPPSMAAYGYGPAQYEHALELYGVCVYVALTNIFGGSCEINPNTANEYFVQAGMMLIGSCVWAYIIGSCCSTLSTLDPALIEFRTTMDELNVFVRDQGLPQDLTVRLRSYFRNTTYLIRARRNEKLLSKMSNRLRGDASLIVATRVCKRVAYLANPAIESEFLCHLTTRFTLGIFSRLERISTDRLFVIDRGVCARRGKIALIGSCLGEDMIITNALLRSVSDAIALTFVQIVSVSRESLFEVLPEFPVAYSVVRRAAYRLAFRRFIIAAAEAGIKAATSSSNHHGATSSDSSAVLAMAGSGTGPTAPLTRTRFSSLRRPVALVVDVEQAVEALKQRHVNLKNAPAALGGTRNVFGGVNVSLYRGKDTSMEGNIAAMDERISAMGGELSTVNEKLDALTRQFGTCMSMLSTIASPGISPGQRMRARSKKNTLGVAAAPASAPEALPTVMASSKHRSAEKDEMREAFMIEDAPSAGSLAA